MSNDGWNTLLLTILLQIILFKFYIAILLILLPFCKDWASLKFQIKKKDPKIIPKLTACYTCQNELISFCKTHIFRAQVKENGLKLTHGHSSRVAGPFSHPLRLK